MTLVLTIFDFGFGFVDLCFDFSCEFDDVDCFVLGLNSDLKSNYYFEFEFEPILFFMLMIITILSFRVYFDIMLGGDFDVDTCFGVGM